MLTVSGLTVRFGGVVALDDVSFTVEAGSVCGLIGPNGAGKTTMFNCISRLATPTNGDIAFGGENLLKRGPHQIAELGIARTFQNLALVPSLTVRENVMLGAHHRAQTGFGSAALWLGRARKEEKQLRAETTEVLERLALDHLADHPATGLSYGTLKRLEIARALCQRPKLLLLDEPAAGLSHGEVDELGSLLSEVRESFDLTLLLVEHHMGIVMRLSEHIVVLDFGKVIASGLPEDVQQNPKVVEAYLGTPA